jgi:hypothetical protein
MTVDYSLPKPGEVSIVMYTEQMRQFTLARPLKKGCACHIIAGL